MSNNDLHRNWQELTTVSSQKSPLHSLVQAAQVNHEAWRRHERQEQEQMHLQRSAAHPPSSQAWSVASLMHSWHRGRAASVLGALGASVEAVGATDDVGGDQANSAAFSLTAAQGKQLLAGSRGHCIATVCVKFSQDLLHGELESTEDRASAVLARFELMATRQIEKSYARNGLAVIEAAYDVENSALCFTLDPICEGKVQQEEELTKCVDYVSELIESGLFSIEYPESNLNFCPPQAAQVKITKRPG